MNLLTIFLVTQIIFSSLASIAILVFLFVSIYLVQTAKKINERAIEVIEEGREVATEAKSFIQRLGQSVFVYLITKIRKNIKK